MTIGEHVKSIAGYLKNRYTTKLHIFDIVSIVVVLVIVGVLLFFFKRDKKYITVEMKVTYDSVFWEENLPTNEFVPIYNVGTKKLDSSGNLLAEITDVRIVQSDEEIGKRGVYVTLDLQAVEDKNANQYTFDGLPLLVGSKLELEMEDTFMEGIVTSLEGDDKLTDRFVNEWMNMTVNLTTGPGYSPVPLISGEYVDDYTVGMVANGPLGEVEAEVVNVYTKGSSGLDGERVYLDMRILATHDLQMDRYFYDGHLLAVGETFEQGMGDVSVKGFITSFGDNSVAEEVDLMVDVQVFGVDARGVYPFMADAVQVGDRVYGKDGEVLAEVVSKRVTPANKVTVDDLGVPHLYGDPVGRYIYLTYWMKTKKVNGSYWFAETQRILVGDQLNMRMEKVDLYPIITNFRVAEEPFFTLK